MTICATARPSTELKFDGLIGLWRIQSDYQAQRSSVNHKRGHLYKVHCTTNIWLTLLFQKEEKECHLPQF